MEPRGRLTLDNQTLRAIYRVQVRAQNKSGVLYVSRAFSTVAVKDSVLEAAINPTRHLVTAGNA